MTYIEKRFDTSESVDPQQAIDELLVVAEWIANHVGRDKQRIPAEPRKLLEADERERLEGFTIWEPTRNMVEDKKLKWTRKLFSDVPK